MTKRQEPLRIKRYERIFWTAYSQRERSEVIANVEKIINKYGFITDFKHFSDLSFGLNVETSGKNIEKLYRKLAGFLKMDEYDCQPSDADAEVLILLHINFSRGKGNLKVKIPEVPG